MEKGFSLIEILVYSAIFAVVLILIVGTALGLSRAYGGFSARAALEQDGALVLERLTREVREARGVDTGASTLGVNPSMLVLTKADGMGTTRFSVSGGALRFADNGIEQGALTGNKVSVASFVARRMTTGRSEGVKIELTLHAGEGAASTTRNFYATTLLRDSY